MLLLRFSSLVGECVLAVGAVKCEETAFKVIHERFDVIIILSFISRLISLVFINWVWIMDTKTSTMCCIIWGRSLTNNRRTNSQSGWIIDRKCENCRFQTLSCLLLFFLRSFCLFYANTHHKVQDCLCLFESQNAEKQDFG